MGATAVFGVVLLLLLGDSTLLDAAGDVGLDDPPAACLPETFGAVVPPLIFRAELLAADDDPADDDFSPGPPRFLEPRISTDIAPWGHLGLTSS